MLALAGGAACASIRLAIAASTESDVKLRSVAAAGARPLVESLTKTATGMNS
jgi:hypothetical protein